MISNFLTSVAAPLRRRGSVTLLAMVLAVAVALPSFAEVGGDEGDEVVSVVQTETVPTTEASHTEEAEDDDDDDHDEDENKEESEDGDDGEGSERSIEVHALLDAGCNPGRGIGNKIGHEKHGKFECLLEGSVHPVYGDSESESDHRGQGRSRNKDKKNKGEDDS
jgi:hypothetical protein